MPFEKIMERSGGLKEATDVWVIRFWNFKTIYYIHSVDIYKVRISAQYRYLLCVDIYPAARRTGASSSELVGASLRSSAPAPLPAAALLLGSARPQHSPPRCLFIITLKSGLLCLCNTNSASQLKILGPWPSYSQRMGCWGVLVLKYVVSLLSCRFLKQI